MRYEVGGVGYNPYARGSQGEQGAAQLHPQGKLSEFYGLGYTDPDNPYQAVAYLEDALRRGQANHWSPVVKGLCP